MRAFNSRLHVMFAAGFVAAALVSSTSQVRSQDDSLFPRGLGSSRQNLFGTEADAKPQVSVKLVPADAKPGDAVTLSISVTIPPGSYTYSTNKGFSGGTKIRIIESPGLQADEGDFKADHAPKTVYESVFKQNIEKYFDHVTWTRGFRMLPDAKPEDVAVKAGLDYQVCNDKRCLPLKETYTVTFSAPGGTVSPEIATKPESKSKNVEFTFEATPAVQGKPGPAAIRADLSPKDAKPGDVVTLSVTLKLDPDWHTYSITQPPDQAATATTIKVAGTKGLLPLDAEFIAGSTPKIKELDQGKLKIRQEVHHGEITWTRRYKLQASTSDPGYGLTGSIRFQTCTEKNCLPAKTVSFALGDAPTKAEVAADVPPSPTGEGTSAADGDKLELQESAAAGSLGFYLLTGFFGGLLLNVMPCVLPVLAIKVLSFVQQAGESRGRIFALNAAYAVGVIGVFLTLATLAVVMKKGWGELFQSSEFNLIMACLVFAMGLSLLGVFEIPVPGMVGSAAGTQSQEGLLGAFLTGILATLLATPCSGPLMGATLAWSVRESAAVTYLIWGVMGLGMASPYLVFGMFPKALRWLPKPGMWMVRFKEFSGFVLMGSVIFIIYFLDKTYTIPLLVMLLGIALGLWMIGNLYDINSHIKHKTLVRVTACVLTLVICGVGFGLARPAGEGSSALPWEPFSESRLNELRTQNKTVLIDFTADWCLVCKTNEYQALNTPETLELIRKHEIVPLVADYTDSSEEIKRWLNKFDSVSVPLTVVFPGARPNQPIVIRDLYSQRTLLEKLNEAVAVPRVSHSNANADSFSTTR